MQRQFLKLKNPFYLFSRNLDPADRYNTLHSEIMKGRKVEEAMREVEEKTHSNILAETPITFYNLEIKMELYYIHNELTSNYVKAILDFCNINFIPVI